MNRNAAETQQPSEALGNRNVAPAYGKSPPNKIGMAKIMRQHQQLTRLHNLQKHDLSAAVTRH